MLVPVPSDLFVPNDIRMVYRNSLGMYEYRYTGVAGSLRKAMGLPVGLRPLPLPPEHTEQLCKDIRGLGIKKGDLVLFDLELHVSYTNTTSPWKGKGREIQKERELITALARYHADPDAKIGFTPEDVEGCDLRGDQWYMPNGGPKPGSALPENRRWLPLIYDRVAYGPRQGRVLAVDEEKKIAESIYYVNSKIGLNLGVGCWCPHSTAADQQWFIAFVRRIRDLVVKMEAELEQVPLPDESAAA